MLIRLLVFLICFLAYSSAAFGCSCAPRRTPTLALQNSTAVFSGQVIAVYDGFLGRQIAFTVDKSWKGNNGILVSVFTNSSGTACGFSNVSVGERWIVYAHSFANMLKVSTCSRTTRLERAQQDLQDLGKGSSLFLSGLWIALIIIILNFVLKKNSQ